ncbi:hypothetical protein [Oceanobacillus halophilus]|nr:hypothetical protein [Oceanobacillus halophilus]
MDNQNPELDTFTILNPDFVVDSNGTRMKRSGDDAEKEEPENSKLKVE